MSEMGTSVDIDYHHVLLIWLPKSFDSTANFTVGMPVDFHCITVLVMSFEMYITSVGGLPE
jgi:hypothetical protein